MAKCFSRFSGEGQGQAFTRMHDFSTIQNTFLNALYNSMVKQAKNSIQYCQNLQNVQESIIANQQENVRWQNRMSFVSSREKSHMNGWLEQNVQKQDFGRNTSPETAKLISIKDQFKNKFNYEFDDKFGKTKPTVYPKLTHQQICDTLNRKIREAKNMEMNSNQITTMVCPNVEIRPSVIQAALPSKMSNGIVILNDLLTGIIRDESLHEHFRNRLNVAHPIRVLQIETSFLSISGHFPTSTFKEFAVGGHLIKDHTVRSNILVRLPKMVIFEVFGVNVSAKK